MRACARVRACVFGGRDMMGFENAREDREVFQIRPEVLGDLKQTHTLGKQTHALFKQMHALFEQTNAL